MQHGRDLGKEGGETEEAVTSRTKKVRFDSKITADMVVIARGRLSLKGRSKGVDDERDLLPIFVITYSSNFQIGRRDPYLSSPQRPARIINMPLLFPQLRVSQVFGANTEVGKTLLTTALLRSTASLYSRQHAAEGTSTTHKQKKVFYLKPISTGSAEEADDSFVQRNSGKWKSGIETKCLYQYREPVSPHLAAKLAPDLDFPRTNEHLLDGISRHVRDCASTSPGSLWLETAGGVHSPSLHAPLTQVDSLRPLFLPTLLIGSPHLGGISTTVSAYESLLMRGYPISGVLVLRDPYYRNEDFLRPYFEERGIPFWTVEKPHVRSKGMSMAEDVRLLDAWYRDLEDGKEDRADEAMVDVARKLEEAHVKRIAELESMPRRTLDKIWWPFTQHGLVTKESDVMVIDSAKGDNFDAFYKSQNSADSSVSSSSKDMLTPLFDGSASWFTQSHGHANIDLTLAAAQASGRYGHVLFPSGTHQPALALAEQILSTVGKDWASRVFYSDNGSTGVESALKMAIRSAGKRYGWTGVEGTDVGVIGLRGGYHGDTIGTMDAAEQSIYNDSVDWYRGRGHWFSPPQVQIMDGQVTISSTGPEDWPKHPKHDTESVAQEPSGEWKVTFPNVETVYDVESRLDSPLATYYRQHIRSEIKRITSTPDHVTGKPKKFGALVLEPICLGAAGMIFVDPLFQRCLVDVVREGGDMFGGDAGIVEGKGNWSGLPVIFDEVFSGLHRLGYLTAPEILKVNPDISVYAKILTGGLLPLSITMASDSIFQSFLHPERKVDALLHGHSYTANPIGCNVALKALQLVQNEEAVKGGSWDQAKEKWMSIGDCGHEKAPSAWSFWDKTFIEELSKLSNVKGVMSMGTVLAFELEEPAGAAFTGEFSLLSITSPLVTDGLQKEVK